MRNRFVVGLAALALAAALGVRAAPAETPALTVAAAANLADVIEVLDAAFDKHFPGAEVKVSTGASGNFYAQIKNGAPFDVFVSADMDFPRKLAAEGDAQADSLLLYAIGQLVLWSPNPAVDVSRGFAVASAPEVKKLAIANTETAPYGRAAKAALQQAGLWDQVQDKLVTGENISQTAQFVQTGSADAGFVAFSTLKSPKLDGIGKYWLVPLTAYPPLEQGAVITAHGKGNPLAPRYLAFLHSAEARAIFVQYGYAVPDSSAH